MALGAEEIQREGFSGKRFAILLFLALTAFLIRMNFLMDLANSPYASIEYTRNEDQFHLHSGAVAFTEGDLLARSPIEGANNYSPVYKYFVGTIYAIFGAKYLPVYFFQMLLGSIGVVLLFLIANKTLHVAGAVLASLGFALYVPEIIYEGTLLRGSFLTFFGLFSCYLFVRLKDNLNMGNLICSTLALSVFIQIRPNVMLVLPFVLWYLGNEILEGATPEKKKNTWILFSGTLLLSFIPMLVQAYLVHGHFVFFDASGPQVLLNCNVPAYQGFGYSSRAFVDAYQYPPPKSILDAVSLLLNQWWQEPLGMSQMMGRKIFFLFNDLEPSNNISPILYAEMFRLSPYLINHFSIISSFGVLGIVISFIGKDGNGLTRGYALGLILALVPICVLSRFRLPLVPFLFLFSSVGFFFVLGKLKEGRLIAGASSAAVILGLFFLFQVPEGVSKIRPQDHCNRAVTFLTSDHVNRFIEAEQSGIACLKNSEPGSNLYDKAKHTLGYGYFLYIVNSIQGVALETGEKVISRGIVLAPEEVAWFVYRATIYRKFEKWDQLKVSLHAGKYFFPQQSFFSEQIHAMNSQGKTEGEELSLWRKLIASPESGEVRKRIFEFYKNKRESPFAFLLLSKWRESTPSENQAEWVEREFRVQSGRWFSSGFNLLLSKELDQETR